MIKLWDDFIALVSKENIEFVTNLHQNFVEKSYQTTIKPAKSGFVVSYLKDKRTIATYIFRKSGMKLRLYPEQVQSYETFLNELPQSMKKDIVKASSCKRLIDPNACNRQCRQGYDFFMDGVHYQKCRYMAFMFNVNEIHQPYLLKFMDTYL